MSSTACPHTFSTTASMAPRSVTTNAQVLSITKRRTWKTMKSTTEAVWPPKVEAALIEALEQYRPSPSSSSRSCIAESRPLLRFPKRNRWIANYILQTTGKERSAKQVGSRLQQLRDTCQDPHILELLSKKPYSEKRTVDSSKRVRARHTIQLHDPSIPPSTTVSIDVYCDSPPANSNPPQHSPAPDRRITIMAEPNLDISDLHPVVSFTAGSPISTTDHWSRFEVIVGGAKVHEELTSLVDITGPSGRPSYQTSLIPQHWVQLTQTTDLSTCRIIQNIVTYRDGVLAVILNVTYTVSCFRKYDLELVANSPDQVFSNCETEPVANSPDQVFSKYDAELVANSTEQVFLNHTRDPWAPYPSLWSEVPHESLPISSNTSSSTTVSSPCSLYSLSSFGSEYEPAAAVVGQDLYNSSFTGIRAPQIHDLVVPQDLITQDNEYYHSYGKPGNLQIPYESNFVSYGNIYESAGNAWTFPQ